MGMLAGVADCRRSRKGAAKEDGNWDLNLGPAGIERKRPCGSIVVEEDHKVLGEKGGDHAALKEGVDHVAPK